MMAAVFITKNNIISLMIIFLVSYKINCQSTTNGLYTLVAPRVLRPNVDYHVSVTVHNTTQPTHVVMQLTGSGSRGGVGVSNELDITAGETRLIRFQIGDWSPGIYKLQVVGTGGMNFKNESTVRFVARSYNVFVQTDKSIYRPSQKVQFRAIILDKNLWPRRPSSVDIFITDADGNRIKEYKGVNIRTGLTSEELQLSDQPVLGDWTIHVLVSGQEYTKNFTVAQYILPGYYVTVKLDPPFITYANSRVIATVSSKYTYGKPVKGSVTLTVVPKHRTSSIAVRPLGSYQIILPFDKERSIELDVTRELNLITDKLKREIEFIAIVEEELTLRRFNGTNTIFIYDDPIKVEMIKTSDSFKPGLGYKAFLKVSTQDGTPVNDPNGALTLYYGYNYDPESRRSRRFKIPQNGIIEMDFYPPLSKDTVTIFAEAEYNGRNYELGYVEKAHSPSDTYIQLSVNTPSPQVQQEVEIQVNATSNLPRYVYEVVARGDIVISASIYPDYRSSHVFRIPLSSQMTPLVRIVVYFVRDDGEVVADGLSLEVDEIFQNKVSLSAGPSLVRPGENVRVSVATTPNSMVGLMGIDQSVLLLKTGNDISKSDVIKSMESFDIGKKSVSEDPIFQLPVRQGRSLFYPGSLSSSSVFKDAGVFVLTNGILSTFDPRKSKSAPPGQSVFDVRIVRFGAAGDPIHHPEPETPMIKVDLPPTWLWWNETARPDGIVNVDRPAPDTITSWILSAFSISPSTGLALSPNIAKVTVFRRFFVKLILPYSVTMGEVVSIQAVVFNYNDRAVEAEVVMVNKGGFEFMTVSNDESIRRAERMSKIIYIPAQEGAAAYFMIKPTTTGFIDIKVFARSSLAGDGLEKKLKVKPPGVKHHFNKAILIDKRSSRGDEFPITVNINIPRTVVQGSESVQVSAISDVMGPAVNNLDDLVRLPYGCGEQNMIKFVPNIVAIDYLKRINQLLPNIHSKAISNIASGYQRQLTYKHEDGSFSAFGKSDKTGSTWLTALVAKSFRQAKQHIPDMIDDEIIRKSLEWLKNQQSANGTFTEVGVVNHKEMQGGTSQGLPLTAYTLIAFHVNRDVYLNYKELKTSADLAKSTLERMYPFAQDTYSLAIITYALHLVNSGQKDGAFQRLSSRAKEEDDTMYWSKPVDLPNNPEETFHLPQSLDVEMTSYALMTYVLRGDIATSLRIMKWLVQQRNNHGGFTSTQDTIIGMQALSMLADSLRSSSSNLDVTFNYDANPKTGKYNGDQSHAGSKKLRITPVNYRQIQKLELPKTVREVNISVQGNGMAVIQVSWSFNLEVSAPNPSFTLNPLVDKVSTRNYLQVSSCTAYIPRGEESNMAVMEYYAPSGYVIDKEALSSIRHVDGVKRVETGQDDTMVTIYFDTIGNNQVCPTVSSHRVHRVANQKPVPVVVYDYYNRDKVARIFYTPYVTTTQEICDGYECDKRDDTYNKANIDLKKKNGAQTVLRATSSIAFTVMLAIAVQRFLY